MKVKRIIGILMASLPLIILFVAITTINGMLGVISFLFAMSILTLIFGYITMFGFHLLEKDKGGN